MIEHLNGRINDMKEAVSDADRDDLLESVLSVDEIQIYDVLLSFGGGSDWFRVKAKGGEVVEVSYFYADWGWSEEYQLTDEETSLFFEIYGGLLPENLKW